FDQRVDDDVVVIAGGAGQEAAARHRLNHLPDGGAALRHAGAGDELAVFGEQVGVGGEVLPVEHDLVLHEQPPDLLQVLQAAEPGRDVTRVRVGRGRRGGLRVLAPDRG